MRRNTAPTALLIAMALGSLGSTGCTTLGPSLGWMATPIPITAYQQKKHEDQFWNHERYDRAPILGPITSGAEVVALPPGHPYLRLPLQFAASLEKRLLSLMSADERGELRTVGEAELQEPGRWGTTFTLLQCWGRCPA